MEETGRFATVVFDVVGFLCPLASWLVVVRVRGRSTAVTQRWWNYHEFDNMFEILGEGPRVFTWQVPECTCALLPSLWLILAVGESHGPCRTQIRRCEEASWLFIALVVAAHDQRCVAAAVEKKRHPSALAADGDGCCVGDGAGVLALAPRFKSLSWILICRLSHDLHDWWCGKGLWRLLCRRKWRRMSVSWKLWFLYCRVSCSLSLTFCEDAKRTAEPTFSNERMKKRDRWPKG